MISCRNCGDVLEDSQFKILRFLEDFRRDEVEASVRGQVDKIINYFNRGHHVDGLILFMQVCVATNKVDECLWLFAQVCLKCKLPILSGFVL